MQLRQFKVPYHVLTNESHDEERDIIKAMFGHIEESEKWISSAAAIVSGFLGRRISHTQASELNVKSQVSTEVLIGGSEKT